MASLNIDDWALHRITLDSADQFVPNVLIANANDASGRGIDLHVTKDGAALDMTGTKVYLVWRHDNGNQDLTQFTAVDSGSGHFKVYYPNAMMHGGAVLARIAIYVGGEAPITGSRDFRISVEPNPLNEAEAMADESFTVFQRAVVDLNELSASIAEAESARSAAESGRAAAEDGRASAESGRNAGFASAIEAARAATAAADESASAAREAGSIADAAAADAGSAAFAASMAAENAASAAAAASSQQAKNNADQAANNAAAQGLNVQILTDGQYDASTRAPTIEGDVGKLYFVPAADDQSDAYAEWMLISGKWERIGMSNATIEAVTTDDIDDVVGGSPKIGTRVLNLTGMGYLWAKLSETTQRMFSPITHTHSASDIGAASKDDLNSVAEKASDAADTIESLNLKIVAGALSFAKKVHNAAVFGASQFAAVLAGRLLVEGTEALALVSPSARLELYKNDGFKLETTLNGKSAMIKYNPSIPNLQLLNNADGKSCVLTLNKDEMWLNGVNVIGEKYLYNNPGTHDGGHEATLSERGANFRYLDIYYHDNDGNYASTRVMAHDGAKFCLSTIWCDNTSGGNTWIKARVVELQGNVIRTYKSTWNRTGDTQFNNGTVNFTYIAHITIDRVCGVKA